MNHTRSTLLARVRDAGDHDAWEQFFAIYAPLLYGYARSRGLAHEDGEEVRDRCLAIVVTRMPEFQYDRTKGRFKTWLHRIVSGLVIDWLRARRARGAMEEVDLDRLISDTPAPDKIWEHHWRQQHLVYCLDRVKREVSPVTHEAFRMLLVDAASVSDVCNKLGLNANQVYKAKGRVLERIRDQILRLEE